MLLFFSLFLEFDLYLYDSRAHLGVKSLTFWSPVNFVLSTQAALFSIVFHSNYIFHGLMVCLYLLFAFYFPTAKRDYQSHWSLKKAIRQAI